MWSVIELFFMVPKLQRFLVGGPEKPNDLRAAYLKYDLRVLI